jgi:hypothetical protein
MSELEVIQAVVLTHLTLGVGDIARAPLKGVAADLEARVRTNLSRIGQNAERKTAGQALEANARVLSKALIEGGYAEDEIVVDYLGGVLAASTSDDAAAPIIAQIGRLSSVQLRLHFVIYREIRRLNLSRNIPFYSAGASKQGEVSIDASELLAAVNAEWNVVGSGLAVLAREGLLRDFELRVETETQPALALAHPSGLGAELFLWGNGTRATEAREMLNPNVEVRFEADVPATPSARATQSAP